jgi:hypothetical protein
MKNIKYLLAFLLLINQTNNVLAQSESFFVSTASKVARWEFVKAEFDKYEFGKLVLKKTEKKFGVATSINIEADGSFMWNVTNTKGNTTNVGKITETGEDNFFEFSDGQKLKVNASFKDYDNVMQLTIYGMEKDEYVTLIYKNKKTEQP